MKYRSKQSPDMKINLKKTSLLGEDLGFGAAVIVGEPYNIFYQSHIHFYVQFFVFVGVKVHQIW